MSSPTHESKIASFSLDSYLELLSLSSCSVITRNIPAFFLLTRAISPLLPRLIAGFEEEPCTLLLRFCLLVQVKSCNCLVHLL